MTPFPDLEERRETVPRESLPAFPESGKESGRTKAFLDIEEKKGGRVWPNETFWSPERGVRHCEAVAIVRGQPHRVV